MIFKNYTLKPFSVMALKVNKFPEDFQSCYSLIGNKIKSISDRKILGTLYFTNDPIDYSICVEQRSTDSPELLGLVPQVLPGGNYIKTSLINWESKLDSIKEIYSELRTKYLLDDQRPQLEFFKSKRELTLYFPIKMREEQLKLDLF